jgi:ABC-type protease/lipase transport system fused ATPase/permease subunit
MRSFLGGDAILAFLDVPWMPIFIAVIWLMHPVLGWLVLAGAIILLIVAVGNDLLTRRVLQQSRATLRRNQRGVKHYLDNAETVRVLGMLGSLLHRWENARRRLRDDPDQASAVTSRLRCSDARNARVFFWTRSSEPRPIPTCPASAGPLCPQKPVRSCKSHPACI